ncbi:hypothetical protein V8F33_003880 [Rhypophila sp. PSN 637]
MGSFVRNKSILTIITIGTLVTVASMAIYKIAVRMNGAGEPTPPPTSGLQQNDQGSKGKRQLDNSPTLPPTSAKSMARFNVDQTITPQYQQQLYRKTVSLIFARTVLNKKLSRAFSRRDKFSHKLLDRHYRLKHQERKHLTARTRLVLELEKQQNLNPSPERAKNIRLLKKLLRTFKRHLKSDTYAHKSKCLRPSPMSSISTSPSSSDMDEHESAIGNAILSIAAEKLGSEMATVNGTARKRRASQRSNASLATLFAQDHPEQAEKDIDGALAVPKQIKKPKLDLEDDPKPTETAGTGPQLGDDAKEGKVEASTGNDANLKLKSFEKTPPPASRASAKLEADDVEKEANTGAGAPPPPTKSEVEEKEDPSCAGALPVETLAKPEVDDEKKTAGADASVVAYPTASTADAKEKRADSVAAAVSSPTKSVSSDKEDKIVDAAASPNKNAKKHPLDSDDSPSKAKKAKVEYLATPAVPAKSPRKVTSAVPPTSPKRNNPAAPLKYHEQVVHDMLNDPLGFDDLVCDSKGPMHNRNRFRSFRNRYKKPAPNFSPLMSGGIGKDLPEVKKSTAAAAPKTRKPLPPARKDGKTMLPPARNDGQKMSPPTGNNGEKLNLKKEDSLSKEVLRKNYRDRMTQRVQESKAAASEEKKTPVLDKLTEKSKYSVNKEARYARNKSQNLENAGLAIAGLTRPIPAQAPPREGPKPKTYVSAARRKHNAVRQVGLYK